MQQRIGLEKKRPSYNLRNFCRFEPIQTSELLTFDLRYEEESQRNKKRNKLSQSSLQMSREEGGESCSKSDFGFSKLMSACQQNLEHQVTRILLKKVRLEREVEISRTLTFMVALDSHVDRVEHF